MRGPLCDNCWLACKTTPPTPECSRSSQSSLWRPPSSESHREEKLSRQSSGGHGSSSANTAANSPTDDTRKPTDDFESIRSKDINFDNSENKKEQASEASKLEQMINTEKHEDYVPCACWCQGWAEIYVRRPTGDMSWIMRIQNSMQFETSHDFPLHDITSLYMPFSDFPSQKSQHLSTEFLGDQNEVYFICIL